MNQGESEAAEAKVPECPICGRSGYMVMDHDHANGSCRELICQRCNVVVGALEAPHVEACVAYVAKWKAIHRRGPTLPYTEYQRLQAGRPLHTPLGFTQIQSDDPNVELWAPVQ